MTKIDVGVLEGLATPERAAAMFASRDRIKFCREIVEAAGLPGWQGRTLEAYLSNYMTYGTPLPRDKD